MAATDLYDLLNEYLGACHAALADTPGGQIDRRYVSPGIPAWDCPEQLTVHAGGPAEADTLPSAPVLVQGRRSDVTAAVNLIAMTATVLRCVPVSQKNGQPPAAAALDAAARETTSDVWAIWNHLRSRVRAKSIFLTASGDVRELILDPAAAVLTQGGAAGWQIQIRVALDGYRTVLP